MAQDREMWPVASKRAKSFSLSTAVDRNPGQPLEARFQL